MVEESEASEPSGRYRRAEVYTAGREGVGAILTNVLADLDLALGLTGHDAVRDVDRGCPVENPAFG